MRSWSLSLSRSRGVISFGSLSPNEGLRYFSKRFSSCFFPFSSGLDSPGTFSKAARTSSGRPPPPLLAWLVLASAPLDGSLSFDCLRSAEETQLAPPSCPRVRLLPAFSSISLPVLSIHNVEDRLRLAVRRRRALDVKNAWIFRLDCSLLALAWPPSVPNTVGSENQRCYFIERSLKIPTIFIPHTIPHTAIRLR